MDIEKSLGNVTFYFIHYQTVVSPWYFEYSTNLVENFLAVFSISLVENL